VWIRFHGPMEFLRSTALTFFFTAANELSRNATVLLKDSAYFSQAQFEQRFNTIAFAKDQRALIAQVVFSNRYYSCWRPTRVSLDTEQYSCQLPPLHMQDTSICEAAERRLATQGETVFLLRPPFRPLLSGTASPSMPSINSRYTGSSIASAILSRVSRVGTARPCSSHEIRQRGRPQRRSKSDCETPRASVRPSDAHRR
jgi:hypothetical protein